MKKIQKIQILLIGVNAVLLGLIIIMLPKFIGLQNQLKEYDVDVYELAAISSSDSVNDITVIDYVDFPYCKVYSANDASTLRVAANGIWESYILSLINSQSDSYVSYMVIDELTILAGDINEFVFELKLNPYYLSDDAEVITQTGKSHTQVIFKQMFRAKLDNEKHQVFLKEVGANLDYSDLPLYEGDFK